MTTADRKVSSRSVDDIDALVPSWRLSARGGEQVSENDRVLSDGLRQFALPRRVPDRARHAER